jgi:tetratricopeptide (TPR) repeat protein
VTLDGKLEDLMRLAIAVLVLSTTLMMAFNLRLPADPAGEQPAPVKEVPLFEGLGKHTRPVTTRSPDAQRYFDQGLNFLFAFNHDEAIRSFARAAELDPTCAMAHWGIALANGPHINFPLVPPERARAAWSALAKAREHAKAGTEAEQALIEALGKRYADPQPEDRRPLDEAYAAAMRAVSQRFPKDSDVAALFAESLMDLRPWDLWSADGKPRPETPEVVETLERVLKQSPDHPLALHLYIHAVEASPSPEKSAAAADRLRKLAPGLGHLVHMPSHIDLRLGQWQKAVEANERAITADTQYRQKAPGQGFYRIYMAHNRHMLSFAAMMQGESRRALDAVRAMLDEIPEEWLAKDGNAAIVDGFYAMPIEVLVRFGRWEDVLKEPEPADRFPLARAMRHAARGVAHAALGKPAEARAEQKSFRAAVERLPKEAAFGNNKAADILAVADKLLEGETLIAEGKVACGLAVLREAVEKEDALKYAEPPDWIHPVRHALGATLLKAGKAAEAEAVYREDLKRWPTNGWSLYGLARSLEAQGKDAAEVRKQFDESWKRADVKLSSSCFCQPGNQ